METKTKNTDNPALEQTAQTQTVALPQIMDKGTCGANENPGSVTWSLDEAGVLAVSGNGEMHKGIYCRCIKGKDNIKSAIIHSGVTGLEESCFSGCNNLASITIGSDVKSINYSAFSDCKLGSITVVPENATYSSEEGVLFNKDKTELLFYPFWKRNQTYRLPDSVTSIRSFAFLGFQITFSDLPRRTCGCVRCSPRTNRTIEIEEMSIEAEERFGPKQLTIYCNAKRYASRLC